MKDSAKDRRKASRLRSFLQGRIYFNNRRSSIDCLVRDISEEGAKLRFSEAIAIPEALELYLPSKEETFRARVQWRTGDEVGAAFSEVASPPLAPAAPGTADMAGRLHKLEADVTSLQRKVSDLQAQLRKIQGVES